MIISVLWELKKKGRANDTLKNIRKPLEVIARHSRNGNLTVNTLLRYLPQNLIEYVTYHETVHALERRHSEKF